MISTVIVAFSMFSAIPMPQTEWTNKSMRYALCAFPLIGAVIGALVCLWRFVCLRMEFSEWILAAGICVLPVLVTGGIHLDGFCDTADALASHQDTEKKLQILKDPHMGAFAAIWLGCYFIAQLALAVTAAQMQADLMALGLSGGPGAAERRKELLHRLELPERLSPNALLEVLNALFTLGELEDTVWGADAKKFS